MEEWGLLQNVGFYKGEEGELLLTIAQQLLC